MCVALCQDVSIPGTISVEVGTWRASLRCWSSSFMIFFRTTSLYGPRTRGFFPCLIFFAHRLQISFLFAARRTAYEKYSPHAGHISPLIYSSPVRRRGPSTLARGIRNRAIGPLCHRARLGVLEEPPVREEKKAPSPAL